MDLRQIRYFVATARLGSFTRAAEQLRIAQPAISMAVRRLEDELELPLLNRQDKRVTLTAEGEIFLEHALRLLGDVKTAEQEMADLRGLEKGEVRIGIPPMSAYFFPDIIRDFKQRYPQLTLSVYGEGGWRIQKMIVQGELDMGIIAGRNVPDALDTRQFVREEVVICIPPGHPFAGRSGVPFSEFIQQPLLFFKEGYYLRELMQEMVKGAGAELRIVFETNLFSLVKPLVKNGLGISTFLRVVVAGDNDLVAVSFDPPLYIDLLIAWKRGAYLSRANRAFVDFMLERIAEYGEDQGKR
ncbi:putative HTH-type transcriptional regulator YwbI [Geobacter sp. OR-1]|uniref:LysR family transcriptional regulator n=1 Tax=Geobacter sp. OR-1 TaxID=1266765 RepID=UPI000541D36D|nr:LysR family transcriptional regulator [Geobacter sp. OR-1]GAM11441.1 putative HTH-type transcriptional regulator YwbI [Geobacter sp. OR-1]